MAGSVIEATGRMEFEDGSRITSNLSSVAAFRALALHLRLTRLQCWGGPSRGR